MKLKNFKGILGLMVCLLILLGGNMSAQAEQYKGSCGKSANWKLDTETGVLNIYGLGEMNDYRPYYDAPWYEYREQIVAVIVENGIVSVGAYAFDCCENLKNADLADSIQTIGDNAFSSCTGLIELYLPKNLEFIGNSAFSRCKGLTELSLPKNLKFMGECAFWECSGISELIFSEGLTEIGDLAFHECRSLKKAELPNSLVNFGQESFAGCASLEEVTLPENITKISGGAFSGCTQLTSIKIPEQVTIIEDRAFEGCSSLKDVSLSVNLLELGDFAFNGCNSLKELVLPKKLQIIRDWAFLDCAALVEMTFPYSVKEVYTEVLSGCTQLEKVTFLNPDCIIDIASYGRENFGTVGKVTIYGYENSTAHAKASELGYAFETLGQPDGVTRIYGATRYETSYAVANALKEQQNVEQFDTVILADGRNFPDALAGSYLAGKLNAPILMANEKSHYAEPLRKYINENLKSGGTICVLGGTSAVPDSVLAGLSGYHVKRIAGKDRYETNLLILEEAGVANHDILICTGKGFADSLSASATGYPILLVNNKALSDGQKAFLKDHRTNQYYIIGGESAVSTKMAGMISAYGKTERVAGESRYETSVKVAEEFFANPKAAVLAYAKNFPDGLCGGPLAMNMDAPLILTATGKTDAAEGYVKSEGIIKGNVLGGDDLISNEAVNDIFF